MWKRLAATIGQNCLPTSSDVLDVFVSTDVSRRVDDDTESAVGGRGAAGGRAEDAVRRMNALAFFAHRLAAAFCAAQVRCFNRLGDA